MIDESEGDWEYEDIPIEEFEELSESDGEESLEKAVKNISEKAFFGGLNNLILCSSSIGFYDKK